MTDDAKVIESVAERLRFFFSDANLRTDKFMRKEMEKKENGGCIPISVLLRFNTIKSHTEDAKVVVEAAKHDSLAERVKLNDEETAVGRVVPFDKSKMNDNVKLSLRVENLPVTEPKEGEEGEAKYAVTVDEIKEVFSAYGDVMLVKLSYYRPGFGKRGGEDKDMKKYGRQGTSVATGAAFVEFDTEEQLTKAAAELCAGEEGKDSPKKLELKGKVLEIKTMKKWVEQKEAKRKEERGGDGGKSPNKGGKSPNKGGRGSGGEKGGEEDKENKDNDVKEFTLDWKKGRVISVKGFGGSCSREAIIEAVGKFLDRVEANAKTLGVYADFSRGQKDGAIRFDSVGPVSGVEDDKVVEKAKELAEKLNDGSITVGGVKVASAAILEGEEEEAYYKNFIEFKNKKRQQEAENGRRRKKQRRD